MKNVTPFMIPSAALVLLLILFVSPAIENPSLAVFAAEKKKSSLDPDFENGCKLYLDGLYEDANASLEKAGKRDPQNCRIRYYLGICNIRMQNRDEAEKHFDFILQNAKDPQSKLLAETWLARIGRRRNHIGDNYSVAAPQVAKEHGPVASVTWFYTDWCPKCRRFREAFTQAKDSFKDLKLKDLNAEDPANWELVSKYHVKSYPTLVYFDKKGTVIENYAAAPMGNTFARHLISLGASVPPGMKSILDSPISGSSGTRPPGSGTSGTNSPGSGPSGTSSAGSGSSGIGPIKR